MRNGQSTGYLNVIGEGGIERDTLTCSHCQRQVVIAPKKGATEQRLDRCGACSSTICPTCAAELARTLKCIPFQKKLDLVESAAALHRACGL